eukprot:gene28206-18353_t
MECYKYEGTQHLRSDGECSDQVAILNELTKVCDNTISASAPLRCVSIDGKDVIRIFSGASSAECGAVASAMNKMAGNAIFADGFTESDSTLDCTIEGYIIADLNKCDATSTSATSTVTSTAVTAAITCVTIDSESYLKVDTGATPNNCVNHRHELNQIIEQCGSTVTEMQCQRDVVTKNHNMLRFTDQTKCEAGAAILNKVIEDITPYVDDDFGTVQCSPEGFLKDSTGGSPYAKCATTAAALNRAIGLWQSGTYTGCDFTTLTTTATSTITSVPSTSTVTSTASSTMSTS